MKKREIAHYMDPAGGNKLTAPSCFMADDVSLNERKFANVNRPRRATKRKASQEGEKSPRPFQDHIQTSRRKEGRSQMKASPVCDQEGRTNASKRGQRSSQHYIFISSDSEGMGREIKTESCSQERPKKVRKTSQAPPQDFIIISSGSEEVSRDVEAKVRSGGGTTKQNKTDQRRPQHHIFISSESEKGRDARTKTRSEAGQEGGGKRTRKSPEQFQIHIKTPSGSEGTIPLETRPPQEESGSMDVNPQISLDSFSFSSYYSHTLNSNNIFEDNREAFHLKYIQKKCLGQGGFGLVFGGYSRADMKPVAIKHIRQKNVDRIPVFLKGKMHFLPLEAVLMYFAMSGQESLPGYSPTVALLDCFDLDDEVVLVMERPEPCMDLSQYIKVFGQMDENMAKKIHRQVVNAAMHMHLRQIFHRDIKTSNILLQLNSPDPCAKVIDFGCGAILTSTTYKTPTGTILSSPPEMLQKMCSYSAEPTTVWQLGVVLYTMLYGYRPFTDVAQIVNHITPICDHVSSSCRNLLVSSLAKNPEDRPTLEEVRDHPWLQGLSPESSESAESTEST